MKNCIIFAIEKLAKVTAESFLLPHKESFVFTNNFFFCDFHVRMKRCEKWFRKMSGQMFCMYVKTSKNFYFFN